MRDNTVTCSSGKVVEAIAHGIADAIREARPQWHTFVVGWGNLTVCVYDDHGFLGFCACGPAEACLKFPNWAAECVIGDPPMAERRLEYANPGFCEDLLALLTRSG